MNNTTKLNAIKMVILMIIFSFIQTIIWAQDNTQSTTTTSTHVKTSNSGNSDWYASPWIWVVGGAVFILLLVALTRGNSSKASGSSSTDKVTVTKTVSRDNDSGNA